MLLHRWNPMFPVADFRREMDRLVDGLFQSPRTLNGSGVSSFPMINLWEDSECLFAEAEVPGLSMKDIEVTVVGDELCIKGERKSAQTSEKHTYHRQERPMGVFTRFLTLPVAIEASKVDAVLKDGVLTITLPKAAAARPRLIEVRSDR